MIEEIVINIERLFKELLEELKSGNIEVGKAREITGLDGKSLSKIIFYMKCILGTQFIFVLIQLYILFKQ